jgi:hypothetical protein
MALNPATHTLYVALHDAGEISEINTQTLTETRRFSTTPHSDPSSLVIAGGKLWFSCFQSNGQGCLVSANLDGSGMATPIPGFSFATLLAAGGSGGNLLAIGDSYQAPPTISVYNVAGGVPSLVSTAHPNDGEVASMTFDPSGAKLLLATGAPYYIQSLATNTLLPSGAYPTGPYPVAVAVTANGKYVAGGVHTGTGTGNDVFVYPVGSTTPVRTWHIGDGTTELPDHSLAFSPDASRLFAVAQDSATGHLAFHVLDQPTVPLKATTISMGGSARSVRYGSHASLTVHVSGTATGKVDLYATPNGGTKRLVTTGTLSSGAATFTVTPKQNTTYSAQLEQGPGYASSTSHNVSIAVSPVVSLVARPHRARLSRLGRHWAKATLTAAVHPARPNELLGFVAQRKMGRTWRAVARRSFPIGTGGAVHAWFRTNKPGLCRIRAVYSGDAEYAASKSGWKKFRVLPLR